MLNPREEQVIALLLAGYENKDIAKQLGMKQRTVKSHFNRIFLRYNIIDGVKRVKLAVMFEKPPFKPRIPIPIHTSVDLTSTEETVIQLVATGSKNREIAALLNTTEHVVKNYLRMIYDKLGLWNRVELALWYLSRASDTNRLSSGQFNWIEHRRTGRTNHDGGEAHGVVEIHQASQKLASYLGGAVKSVDRAELYTRSLGRWQYQRTARSL